MMSCTERLPLTRMACNRARSSVRMRGSTPMSALYRAARRSRIEGTASDSHAAASSSNASTFARRASACAALRCCLAGSERGTKGTQEIFPRPLTRRKRIIRS